MNADEFRQVYMVCKTSKELIARLKIYVNSKTAYYEYAYDDIDIYRYGDAKIRAVCFAIPHR